MISKILDVLTFVIVYALALQGCAALRAEQPAACTPGTEAAIEAAFTSEAIVACKLEGAHSTDTCKAYPAIAEKYAQKRKDYVECK